MMKMLVKIKGIEQNLVYSQKCFLYLENGLRVILKTQGIAYKIMDIIINNSQIQDQIYEISYVQDPVTRDAILEDIVLIS